MPERKAAILNVSKALLGVSFAAIAAIGSASGIGWVAGATAVPSAALAASDTIASLLANKKEEVLELPKPPFWTNDAASWQATCASIENRLPAVMSGMAQRLRQEHYLPTTLTIRKAFVDELTLQMPAWEVQIQDRGLVAEYVATPLLEKVAVVLKTMIDPIREDALAKELAKVVSLLEKIEAQQVARTSSSDPPAVSVAPGVLQSTGAAQNVPSPVKMLQQKLQNEAYDVYICYHEADQAEVMKIGEQLKTHSILPWFDILDVKPGTLEKFQQEQQIEKIPSAAVFVGQHAVANWQALQMYAFLEQFVERGCPVIPVLLADASQKPKLPVFLKNFKWVDFREQVPEPMSQLIWGITGKRPHMK